MTQRTRALVAALALLVAAQAAAAKDTWTSVRSQNFFLVGNASEKEIRQVATRLEQFRDVFKRLFAQVNFSSPVPTTVVVFKSDGSYKPFKPVADGKTVAAVAGYFQPGEDVNYITLTTERGSEDTYSIIYHEYVHLLVNNSLGKGTAPAWFNEGLAEYYSTFAIEDDRKVHLGKFVDDHLYLLRQQKMIPLSQLLAVDHHSLERNRHDVRGLFYAQSWALVHYLILGNEGRRLPQLGQFLALTRQGVPAEEAFQRAFQTDTAGMEKELQKYVQGRTFQSKVATFEQKLEFDSQMTTAPLTEAEAEGYLGDLLLHTGRPEDAAVRLVRALQLDPDLTMARASLGMTRLRQKRFDEAKEELRKAVASGAQNYLAHYYYAYALSRQGTREDGYRPGGYPPEAAKEMRESLRKAISLRPDFPESYHLLGWVNLVTGEELEVSAALLRRALGMAPGNQHYALVLAQIYLRQEKFDLARQTAEPLTRDGTEPGLRATAQSVLASIRNYEEQVKQYRARREEYERAAAAGGAPRLQVREGAEKVDTPEKLARSQEEAMAEALGEALRKPEAGETRLRAALTRIECGPKGLVFVFKAGERTLRLTSAGFNGLHIVAYTPEAGAELSCGARKAEAHAVVTYRGKADERAKTDGALVALEFVPASFKLGQ
ncbi:MAG: tetratricopeptide repeat protein [Acidobacteria bacterium]|nr:tetratricopeptide repeat protein [Acidobacteriota bacterium]